MELDDAPVYLTYEQLRSEIKRYTYRPGWELSVFLDPFEGPCLYLVSEVANADDPSEPVQLRIRSNIPPMTSPQKFAEWLQWRLMQVESHECREYLRRDGQALYDPHDPVEPRPDPSS
jgi:hypothetical protein